jgi:WD40 repeat protein
MVQINGFQVATGSSDFSIKIWDISSGALIRSLTGHTGNVTGLVVLPSGYLASGGLDSTVRIWNVQTGVLVTSVTAPSLVMGMLWNSGTGSVSVTMQGSLTGFMSATTYKFTTFGTGSSYYTDFDVIPTTGSVIVLLAPTTLNIYSTAGVKSKFSITQNVLNRVRIAPDNVTAIVGYTTGLLQTANTNTLALGSTISCHSELAVNIIQFTPDKVYLMSVGADNKIWTWTWTATTLTFVNTLSVNTGAWSGLIIKSLYSGLMKKHFY